MNISEVTHNCVEQLVREFNELDKTPRPISLKPSTIKVNFFESGNGRTITARGTLTLKATINAASCADIA